MACYTQGEIAEKEGMTQQAVDLVLQETADLPKLVKPQAEHLTKRKVAQREEEAKRLPKSGRLYLRQAKKEIGKREEVDKATVSRFIEESCNMANLPKSNKPSSDHLFELWMACYTQEEIGQRLGTSQDSISLDTKNSQMGNIGNFLGPDWNARGLAAEAKRVYSKKVNAGVELTNKCTVFKVKIERRLGEILKDQPKAKGAIGSPGPGRGKRGIKKNHV
jgi:hypothetical protein